jgi:hypothetical protein
MKRKTSGIVAYARGILWKSIKQITVLVPIRKKHSCIVFPKKQEQKTEDGFWAHWGAPMTMRSRGITKVIRDYHEMQLERQLHTEIVMATAMDYIICIWQTGNVTTVQDVLRKCNLPIVPQHCPGAWMERELII